ncbi:Hydroperoxy fatty acid reductase gpx1 [Brevundimonas sp. NIBR10]|uniref:glutathione peroxidase n=1 Tax=Brevundimonas sp. NIBR10 TaxID=3015997 RepID=UPI0022F1BFD0|nr:glutathione peroxidase [Brevundimonas sp. NIBR10]WGM47986.1 Hydroperoxy fatty acid reductase gpx1 [Brevundimonas sp. NIBR10]
MTTVYDFTARAIDGADISLDRFRGQALLIVNTASRCGFTGQYSGLEDLHSRFADQPFEVLGFPCNQFGAQEPGSADEIETFCTTHFGASFPLFDKVEVNGPNRHPLYAWLTEQKKGFLGSRTIKWNFTKFLTDREGRVVGRFAPQVTPGSLEAEIARLL